MSRPILHIDRLKRSFGGLIAVNEVAFDVAEGEIVGLLGPNGSGKTTVMNLISGALKPDHGTIRLDGVDLVGLSPHRITRHGAARTFQLVRVLGSMSCLENVISGLAFGREPMVGARARDVAMALLERVGMAAFADTESGELTYINQKRLELARALAARPRLLLLDEWLAGLNPTEMYEGVDLLHSLREEGMTMVLVEHVMDAIRSLCDRCVVMNAGVKIAEGPPEAALADPAVVRAYLGDDGA